MPDGHECVYFIQSQKTGQIKIGYTKHLLKRFAFIQGHSADRLELLIHINAGKEDERALHERFKASRAHGEWFEPTKDLLEAVAKLRASLGPDGLHAYECYKAALY